MTKKKNEVTTAIAAEVIPAPAQGADVVVRAKKHSVELTAEEKAIAADLSIEKGGRMLNKSLSHDLKVARFIKSDFQVPKRLATKADLEKVLETIEAGAGYGDLNGKRIALASLHESKIDAQCTEKVAEFNRLPLNEEQKEAIARTMPKYKAFLTKYVNSQAVALLKDTFQVGE